MKETVKKEILSFKKSISNPKIEIKISSLYKFQDIINVFKALKLNQINYNKFIFDHFSMENKKTNIINEVRDISDETLDDFIAILP